MLFWKENESDLQCVKREHDFIFRVYVAKLY